MEDDLRVSSLPASDLVSASVLASLIGMLGAKGILSDAEVREVYVQALYLLEVHQGEDNPGAVIYDAARKAQLR